MHINELVSNVIPRLHDMKVIMARRTPDVEFYTVEQLNYIIRSTSRRLSSGWAVMLLPLPTNKIIQGSHSTWKTWKNETTPGIPGNIMEF